MTYAVLIERTGAASYCAFSPDIGVCAATGSTPEEAIARFKHAFHHYVRAMRESGRELPEPRTLVDTVEVVNIA